MPHTLGYETSFDLQPQCYVPVPGCGRDSDVLGYDGGGKVILHHRARVSVSAEILSNNKTVSYLRVLGFFKLKIIVFILDFILKNDIPVMYKVTIK